MQFLVFRIWDTPYSISDLGPNPLNNLRWPNVQCALSNSVRVKSSLSYDFPSTSLAHSSERRERRHPNAGSLSCSSFDLDAKLKGFLASPKYGHQLGDAALRLSLQNPGVQERDLSTEYLVWRMYNYGVLHTERRTSSGLGALTWGTKFAVSVTCRVQEAGTAGA